MNCEKAKENKVHQHIVAWNQIKFLSDSKSFESVISAPVQNNNLLTDSCRLMKDIIGNNLYEIVRFLVDFYVI